MMTVLACITIVYCILYVCMYGHLIKRNIDQPGKVANPARGLAEQGK